MVILGIILLVVGLLVGVRVVVYLGVGLIVAGLLLALVAVPGPIGSYWY